MVRVFQKAAVRIGFRVSARDDKSLDVMCFSTSPGRVNNKSLLVRLPIDTFPGCCQQT